MCCVLFDVLCIVCCVSQYCVVPTIKCKKCFKGNYITTRYFVLCIVRCVVYCLLSITVLCCANNQMHKMFQRKLYNNYVFCVVYCLLCCVLFVVYQSTLLCQQSNANFFNKIYLFFIKTKIYFYVNY